MPSVTRTENPWREPGAEYYLLCRSPGGIGVHDPRKLTRACLGGRKINPSHWFRAPRSAVGQEIQGPRLYTCGVCLRKETFWRWNGELMPDEVGA